MKRKLLTVFSLLLSLIGILLIGIACTPKEDFKPEDHEVVEEYYYDANGSEYLFTLYSEDFFTLSIAGEEVQGKYVLEDNAMTLTLDNKGGEIIATLSGNVLNLTYNEVAYNFRLKVDYTVQFDSKGGTSVSEAKVRNGKTVAEPTEPTKDGEVFIGWYTDEAFRNLYEFSRPVTGDLKLYARFVAPIDPEFTVKFDAGAGASNVDPMTTTGGKLYNPDLPVPSKDGAEFMGWYVSGSYTADKLSYRYNEQPIAENITLYALWNDGNPVVSVEEDGVDVEVAIGERYTITITAPDNTAVVNGVSSSAAHYDYNFANQKEGEYKVEVTLGGKTTTRYYNNKALARVSVFEVEESTILFNGVPDATNYLLTVTCGTEGHTHEDIEITSDRSWSFANCDMPAGGLKFVVKAMADGYVTSVSEPYVYTRSLPAVTKVTVSSETEKATWDAVSGATSYFVTVLKGTEEIFADNIGEATSFDLKYYAEGSYTVKVRPVARGWSSPADVQCTYEKTRIATPSGLTYTGNSFTWDAVDGADKYIVTIDGQTYESTTASLSLEGIEFNGAKEAIAVTVRAVKGSVNSIDSDEVLLRATLGNIRYADGKLSWDAVTGVTEYVITIDGGDPIEVEGTSYDITFTHEGNYTFTVSSRLEGGNLSVPKELTVEVYKINFEMDREGADPIPSVYVADNDTIPYPDDPTFYGYTFDKWYTAPDGIKGEGTVYDDKTFRDRQERTLYAGWTANEHTVKFNVGQYGEDLDVESVQVRFGEKATVDGKNLPVPASNDQTRAFAGWYLDANLASRLSDFKGQIVGGGFLQDADVTLYASYVEIFVFGDDAPSKGKFVSKGPGITQGIVTEATIPACVEGKPVTRVIDFKSSTSLEVLNIPDTVTLIDLNNDNTFSGCTALRAVNVYKVEDNTEEVRYSSDNGVLIDTNNGQVMLRYYPAAKSGDYTIPKGVTTIPTGAFANVTGLIKLSISYTVAQIQQDAFKGCTSLQELDFLPTPGGENPTPLDIRDGAFTGCDSITRIHIPTRLDNITAETFSKLTNLEAVTADVGGKYVAIDGLLCTNVDGGAATEYEVIFAPKGKDLGNYSIPANIVSIGERAFYEHPKLTGITIPGYVRNIGEEAFGHITVLETITFSGTKDDQDLVIAKRAFYAGYKGTTGSDSGTNTLVTELHLPANVTMIGDYAFGKYTKLTEVWVDTDRETVDFGDYAFGADNGTTHISYVTTAHIGPKVPAFSYSGFFGSKLATIEVDPDNLYVKSDDDVIYDIEGANILFFPVDKGGEFNIPDGVVAIAPSAFADREELVKVTIPASVTVVGENAFNSCGKLQTVIFRAPEEGEEAAALEIEQRAFYLCSKLSDIELPERLEHLGKNVFYNCDALERIKFPKNLKVIDQAENSSYMGGGTYFDIFQGCDKLKEVTVDEENQYYTGIDGVLYAVKAVKLSADADVTYEPYEVLFTSPGATGNITIPGTIRTVRTYAFRDINNVTGITFTDLVDLYDAETGELDETELKIQSYALYGYNLDTTYGTYNESVKSIVLPKGLKTMSKNFIYDWKGLTSIIIPNTVTSIEAGTFYGSYNIKTVTFEKGGTEGLRIEDGTIDSESMGAYYTGAFTYVSSYTTTTVEFNFTSIVLPARTKYIGNYAFYHQPLTSVTFDDDGEISDLEIGSYAFGYCDKLENFEIPEGTTGILGSAFYYAVLPEIKLPESLVTIGPSAFYYAKLAKPQDKLVIPASVTSIGASAFYDYYNNFKLKEVDLSAATGLTEIGNNAFYGLKQLQTVKFAEATEESPDLTIGLSAFFNCNNLNNVTLPANVISIGNTAFKQNYALDTFTFGTYKTGDNAGKCKLESIGNNVFEKTALTSFSFPESTAADGIDLGEKLFNFCSKLTTVTISKSIRNIDNVFTGCGSLKTVNVAEGSSFFSVDKGKLPVLYDGEGNSVLFVYAAVKGEFEILGGTRIGQGAFNSQVDLEKITIAQSVQEIDSYAFANCINLESVTFKAGSVLTSIGSYAFQNCYKLSSINLEACARLTTLGTDGTGYVFQYCDALTSLELPASLTTIGTYTFAYTGLQSLDLSGCTSLTDLANYALAYDTSLTSVTFPTSLVFLGTNTFRGSDNISEIDLSQTKVYHLSATRDQAQTGNTGLFIFDCEYLETVKLPAGFKSIGLNAFNGATNLNEIIIGDNEPNDLSSLSSFQCGALQHSGIPNVKLPGTITYNTKSPSSSTTYYGIVEGCERLTTVEFVGGANLTEIPRSMFKGCTNLTTVNFDQLKNLATIGQDAFRGCGFTEVDLSKCKGSATFMSATYTFAECANLTKITLPEGVTKVGNYAFMGTGFTSVDLGDFAQFTSWGNYMFQKCLNLTEVTIPSTVNLTASAGTYMFDGCESLRTVNIEEDYKGALPNYMFRGCSQLETVNFNDAKVSALGTNLFQNCVALQSIDLSSSTATALGNYMFAGCENLKDITVPATIKTAGTYTFQNCTSLQTLDLSGTGIGRFASTATGNVTYSLAVHTFEGCTDLKKLSLPAAGITQVGGQVFLNCTSLTEIENLNIAQLTHIGKEAFRNCAYVTGSVALNSQLQVLGENAFFECPGITGFRLADGSTTIEKVTVASTSTSKPDQGYARFDVSTGMLVATKLDTQEVIIYGVPYGSGITDNTLKITGNATIAAYSFQNLKLEGVTKLDLSEMTVESFPNYAFAGAPFTEIVLPDTVKTLGTYTFSDCPNLTTVHLPKELTKMGNYTFQNCESLQEVDYPETLTSIPAYTFKGAGITEFDVPEQVTVIGAYAFQLSKLSKFTVPAWVTQLGQYAFAESEVTSVAFESDPQIIDNKGDVPSIVNSYLFNKCVKLTSVDFGPRTTIYANEFRGCGLKTLTIPETITKMDGGYVFSESALEEIDFEGNPFDSASSMPNYVFQNATSLRTVHLPEDLVGMGNHWFKGCTSLQEVNLPDTLTRIGSATFQDCTSLKKSIVLSESIVEVGANAFNGCVNIPSIELSAGVGTIANTVFAGWTATQRILVRNSRFETCASCGVAWLRDIAAEVVFDYGTQA